MTLRLTPFELTEEDFSQIKRLLYEVCGIDLREGKEGLVKARLGKRLRALGMDTFDAYLDYVQKDETQEELSLLVDFMTTNKTSFFREAQHFEYLRQHLLPQWQERRRLRFWSAACSSGEEPFTLAMVLREGMPDFEQRDVRILATDISTRVLAIGRAGVYDQEQLEAVPAPLRQKYFTCVEIGPPRRYQIADSLKQRVHFARLNLMDPWPMQGPFDAIFCRNAMIYFDKQTKAELIERFYQLLTPGGYLFIGHSESLTGFAHSFHYVQPALYRR